MTKATFQIGQLGGPGNFLSMECEVDFDKENGMWLAVDEDGHQAFSEHKPIAALNLFLDRAVPCEEEDVAPPGPSQPMQPVEMVGEVARFRENKIVRWLLTRAGGGEQVDLNTIARHDFTDADRMQFAQLIGYSVSGFGGLSYAKDEMVRRADAAVERLLADDRQG
jgi:hypothetical protein